MVQFLLIFYRRLISPIVHFLGQSIFGSQFACRFTPTCSQYASQSFRQYGIIIGARLALLRIFRCHPLSQGGFDPVPDKIK